MCGRYLLTTPVDGLARLFGFAERPNLLPRYNIAPTQPAPVVVTLLGQRRLVQMHWGLVPFWSKDASGAARMINARAETVAEKPAYRAAFRDRRCLVPADGFYEWPPGAPKGTGPHCFTGRNRSTFAFAGLWERWQMPDTGEGADGAEAGLLETFTIVSTAANRTMSAFHHRMPLVLPPEAHETWLTGTTEEAGSLLRPGPEGALVHYPVSARVNHVRHDDPECMARIDPEEQAADTNGQLSLL